MISQTLPPIDRFPTVSLEEVVESLALCYLAYYNDQTVLPNMATAYSRAFGLDSLRMFPGDGTNPGFVVTKTTMPHRRFMTVAIEGTTRLDQINLIVEQFGGVPYPGLIGSAKVLNQYKTFAQSVWDRLHADNTIAADIASGPFMFTFTGHSMGAAVADLVSMRWRGVYPAKPARLIKWAAPRFANNAYMQRDYDTLPTRSFYARRDPVHQFPSATVFAMGLWNISRRVLSACMAAGGTVEIVPEYGGGLFYGNHDFAQTSGHFLDVGELLNDFTPDNPWYWHLMKSYRMSMMNMLATRDDTLKYRFNYLEHNDENSWGFRHSPGQLSWAVLDTNPIIIPAPDPVSPISAQVAVAANSPVDTDSDGAGGDWDSQDAAPVPDRAIAPTLPPPIPTALLPRRRFVRPRPN